jgi:hypothetical protein
LKAFESILKQLQVLFKAFESILKHLKVLFKAFESILKHLKESGHKIHNYSEIYFCFLIAG